jgi:polyisoprenoid-binding protein YceI
MRAFCGKQAYRWPYRPEFGAIVGRCVLFTALLVGIASTHATAQTRQYRIDPAMSALRVIVYKDGAFAALAHDHVVVATDLSGAISLDSGDVTRSTVSVQASTGKLTVDAPEDRKVAGLEGAPSEKDRKSIGETMAGPEILDAAKWSTVSGTSAAVSGTLPDLVVSLKVRLKDQEKTLNVPVKVVAGADKLTASGKMELVQSEFGIKPYRALLGTIAVKDTVVVQFDIVAVPQS